MSKVSRTAEEQGRKKVCVTDTNFLLRVLVLMLLRFLSRFVWRDDVQIPTLTHRLRFTFQNGSVQSGEDSQDVLQTVACRFKSKGA